MKKEEIPQDPGALSRHTKEVTYAVDENGNYITALSDGWKIKNEALDVAWGTVEKEIEEAKQQVLDQKISPLFYYMKLKIMDVQIVSDYTGFWKWTIKRHFKPSVFKQLSVSRLNKYAALFEVTVEKLLNPDFDAK